MSISSALSNALSGLAVTSRAADIVSSNIANAMTEGYGVRQVNISSRIVGGGGSGAWVTGVTRHEDPILVGYRRQSDADLGYQSAQSAYLTRLEALIGVPDAAGSLSDRLSRFEAALTAAAGGPQDDARLTAAVEGAVALAQRINMVADGIQAERLRADGDIARAVEKINDTLQQLDRLNQHLRQKGGEDTSAILDAQATLLNEISPLIPLQTRRDAAGALQVYSADGHALLDVRAAELSFSPSTVMQADTTRASGALSGVSLNGRPLPLSGQQAALGGGELAALFALRDDWGPEAQAQIDAVARNLASRFDTAGLDPSLATGDPGLFTDNGLLVDAANEVGLANRLRVNDAVLPAQGGEIWRLRDGLGATAPGAVGNAAFLQGQVDALSDLRPTVSGGFTAKSRSFAGLLSDQLSLTGFARQSADANQANSAARNSALLQEELSQGVDTDAEMQRLIQIEQVFSANARVVTAAQEMIDRLMEIG